MPIGVQSGVLQEPKPAGVVDDPGTPVRMLESSNVDRFLRRAQDFLGREDWPNAIKILQAVIEGRTVEEAEGGTPPGTGVPAVAEPTPAPEDPSAAPAPGGAWQDLGENGTQSVFSADNRLFRPVQRLCHELLASMPPAGTAWYRAQYEVVADKDLAAARAGRDVGALNAIYEHYFLTRSAGLALRAAADLLMDQGRLRAAQQAYRDLLEVYPETLRREAGIDELWVRARIALCLAMLGENNATGAAIADLRDHHGDESLRIEGELLPVKALEQSPLFSAARVTRVTDLGHRPSALAAAGDTPVPLFEFRYADPQPYRPGRNANDDGSVIFVGGDAQGAAAAPRYTDFQPGNSVLFVPGQGPDEAELAFLDHYRLTLIDVPSGRVRAATDLSATVPSPTPGVPRMRIPTYDWMLLRVALAGDRLFTITGPGNVRLSGTKPLTRTTLEARRHSDLSLEWSSANSPILRDACFLATVVIDGDKLFVPAMVSEAFWLVALDARDGSVLFRTPLHREGTELTKPPAAPVVVESGTAYVLTNAGAVAAVDTLTGNLKWIRRYERSDPLRPRARVRVQNDARQMGFGGQVFHEVALDGFAPSDLVLRDGLLVLAPMDGNMLICLDASTGETRWRCERRDMQFPLGVEGDALFVGGEDSVTVLDFASGLRRARIDVPPFEGSANWRGRGMVCNGLVVIPSNRSLLVRRIGDDQGWSTITLPSFRLGLDPLGGPVNLFAQGPWFAAVHAGGIEVFSTNRAMRMVADQLEDPLRKASILAQAGELLAAVDALETIDLVKHPESRAAVGDRMLALSSEIALAYSSHGSREQALAMLDRARKTIQSAPMVERWHLARIEVFHALGDMDAMSDEQQALYKLMETGG